MSAENPTDPSESNQQQTYLAELYNKYGLHYEHVKSLHENNAGLAVAIDVLANAEHDKEGKNKNAILLFYIQFDRASSEDDFINGLRTVIDKITGTKVG